MRLTVKEKWYLKEMLECEKQHYQGETASDTNEKLKMIAIMLEKVKKDLRK